MAAFFIFILFLFNIAIFIGLACTSSSVSSCKKEITNLKNELYGLRRLYNRLNERISNASIVQNQPNNNEVSTQSFEQEQQDIVQAIHQPKVVGKVYRSEVEQYQEQEEFYKEDVEEKIAEEKEEEQKYSSSYAYEEREISTTSHSYREKVHTVPVKKEKSDLENFILGNLFNIIGAIAIIIGSAIFITMNAHLIPPIGKTLIGALLGLVMILLSKNTKKESLKRYSEVLLGTGYSVLFITVYCTTLLFKTFNWETCVCLGGLLLASTFYTANKQKTISMIAIALVGGYLNLLFVSSIASLNFHFGYLLFLNLLSLVYVYKNPTKSIINFINLFTTFFYLVIFQYSNLPDLHIFYPVGLWFIYLAYDLFRDSQEGVNNKLNWANYSVLTLFSVLIFKGSFTKIGFLLLVMSCIYACIFYYAHSQKLKNKNAYMHSMFVSILLSIFFLSTGIYRTYAWAFISLILACCVQKTQRKDVLNWSVIFNSCALGSLFFLPQVFVPIQINEYNPILNNRLVAFIAPIFTLFASSFVLKDITTPFIAQISKLYKFLSISLMYLFLVFEVNNIFLLVSNTRTTDTFFIKLMSYSIVGLIYALHIEFLTKNARNEFYSFVSKFIYALSLFIIVAFGFTYSPIESYIPIVNMRLISFVVAIAVSLMFEKWNKESIYKFVAISLLYLFVTFEVNDILTTKLNHLVVSSTFLKTMVFTIIGFIYSMHMAFKNKVQCYPLYQFASNFLYFTSLIALLILGLNYSPIDAYFPILNIRFFAYIAAIVGALCIEKWHKLKDYRFIAITLAYIIASIEINDCLQAKNMDSSYLSVMSFGLVFLFYSLRINCFGRKMCSEMYKTISILSYAFSSLIILFCGLIANNYGENYTPIFNIRFIEYGFVIFASYLFSKWMKNEFFRYIGLLVGFLLVHTETKTIVDVYLNNAFSLVSIAWLIYAGFITTLGIIKNLKPQKMIGIWISILALLRIIFIDLRNVDMIYKLFIFIALGIVFMVVSYLYNRNKE